MLSQSKFFQSILHRLLLDDEEEDDDDEELLELLLDEEDPFPTGACGCARYLFIALTAFANSSLLGRPGPRLFIADAALILLSWPSLSPIFNRFLFIGGILVLLLFLLFV